jgi:hypothetical protein
MRVTRFSLYVLGVLFCMQGTLFARDSFVFTAIPSSSSVGDTFSITIAASSTSQSMNAVSGTLQVSGGAVVSGVSKTGSIVDFWTTEPQIYGNQIKFEGVVLSPGYQGQNGKLFTITVVAKKEGTATLAFVDGAILANDGLGSNIIDSLSSQSFRIITATPIKVDAIPSRPIAGTTPALSSTKVVALPVITEYSQAVESADAAYIKGKGEPNALTKLSFKDTSLKSLGEQFISMLQSKKKKPTEALVKNDAQGMFQYLSPSNLVAGAYNVTPYLVDEDTQTQKPGFGVQILVNNSKIVKALVVFINILALLIPIVCLGVIIYFIPWYSRLRMKILNHKIALENERLTLTEKELKFKEGRIGSS